MKSEKNKLQQFDMSVYDGMFLNGKTAPICIQDEITSYLNTAYNLCLMFIDPWFDEWVMENFINVYAQSWFDNSFYRVDYLDSNRYYGDFIERKSYNKNFIKPDELIDFIRRQIRYELYYVNLIALDEYYIPQRPSYMKEHFNHEILVYGYDDETKEFDVAGYDISGKFSAFRYSYDDTVKAYSSALNSIADYSQDTIQLLKPRYFYKKYRFKLRRFVNELDNYVHSAEDDRKLFFTLADNLETFYGIEAFKEMCRVMKGKSQPNINIADLHIYYEHKRNLYRKLKFIDTKYYLDEEYCLLLEKYKELVSRANKLRLGYMVKVNGMPDEEMYAGYVFGIADRYEALISDEEKITGEILEYLKRLLDGSAGEIE